MFRWIKYRAFLLLAFAGFLTGCSPEERPDPYPDIPEGWVMLKFSNFTLDSEEAMTRAGEIKPMPVDSTIRVYIYTVPESGDTSNDAVINANPIKEFALRVVKSGNKTIGRMCTVTDDGTFINYSDEEILLPQGRYRIAAISPAKVLPKVPVPGKDGVTQPAYLYRHLTEDLMTTGAEDFDIKAGDQNAIGPGQEGFNVYNVTLPTFRHLMSRITFRLKKSTATGSKIKTLAIEERGIDIDDITPDAYITNFYLGETGILDAGQLGLGGQNITLTEYEDQGNEVYYFSAYMLPSRNNVIDTDGTTSLGQEKTNVTLRFHLLVNEDASGVGNYKAFLFPLPDQRFERGKSYDFEVSVDVGGIFVRGWRDEGWETEI